MNTVVRALPHHSFAVRTKAKTETQQQGWLFILLVALVLLSAVAVVYVKDLHRRYFIDYQNIQDTQNQMYVDWGKLLLEQSTWSTQARVQTVAEQRLNMEMPQPNQVVMVQE